MLNKIEELINSNTESDILYKKWDVKHRNDDFTKVYWSFYPSTNKYFFEANPAFSYEFRDLNDLCRYPITLLRDGFSGILEMFLNNPVPPKDFHSTLLINKKFEKLIPKHWKNHVATYRFQKRQEGPERKKFLVVHGFGTEDIFWKNTPEQLLVDLNQKVREFTDYVCLLPQRDSMMSVEKIKKMNYSVELIKNVYRYLGFEANMQMDVNDYLRTFKMNEFHFYNLDQNKVWLGDNYLDHLFYSKGGTNIAEDNTPLADNRLEYNLSINHKIVIEEANLDQNLFPSFFIQHKLSGKKEVNWIDVYQNRNFKNLFRTHF